MASAEKDGGLAELRSELEKLRDAVRTRVHRQLDEERKRDKTVQSFVIKSLATIVGWFTAKTIQVFITAAMGNLEEKSSVKSFLSSSVNAVICSTIVPVSLWALAGKKFDVDKGVAFKQTQVDLIEHCLPALVAWAWNDWAKAAVAMTTDHVVWPQAVAAVLLTLLVALAEISPCFRNAMARNGKDKSLAMQFHILPKYFALAVGYAWNSLFRFPITKLQELISVAPLFVFMVQVVYFVFMTTFISFVHKLWILRRKRLQKEQTEQTAHTEEDQTPKSEGKMSMQSVETTVTEVLEMSSHIVMDSLQFVYAWAVLDTVNALFFTFLLDCSSATTCSYGSNFGFALLLTVFFTYMASQLSTDHRKSAWNMAAATLLTKSFSLCVGWAWANFCTTAINSALAVDMSVHETAIWLITFGFVWLSVSGLYLRIEQERHAFKRKFEEDAVGHGIEAALAASRRQMFHL